MTTYVRPSWVGPKHLKRKEKKKTDRYEKQIYICNLTFCSDLLHPWTVSIFLSIISNLSLGCV